MKQILSAFLGLTLFAQQPPKQEDLKITTNIQIVVAPTTVTRPDGSYVSGLEAKDFKLYDNEKLQVVEQDVSFIPISLVIAVQRSAQMEQVLPTIQKMHTMVESLILGEQGEVALVGFDHRIDKFCDFTSDANQFRDALQKLRPGSRTSRMTDAVIESARMLKTRPNNRRRILMLVGETKDNGSEGKLKEALTDIQLSNVIVYPVNVSRWINKIMVQDEPPRPSMIPPSARPFPPGAPMTPTTADQMGARGYYGSIIPAITEIFSSTKAIFVDNPQEVYAKYSGGTEQGFINLKGMEQALSRIGEELHSQYLLSYNPNNKEEGGYHTIRVAVERPGLKVRTRTGYWRAAVPN